MSGVGGQRLVTIIKFLVETPARICNESPQSGMKLAGGVRPGHRGKSLAAAPKNPHHAPHLRLMEWKSGGRRYRDSLVGGLGVKRNGIQRAMAQGSDAVSPAMGQVETVPSP